MGAPDPQPLWSSHLLRVGKYWGSPCLVPLPQAIAAAVLENKDAGGATVTLLWSLSFHRGQNGIAVLPSAQLQPGRQETGRVPHLQFTSIASYLFPPSCVQTNRLGGVCWVWNRISLSACFTQPMSLNISKQEQVMYNKWCGTECGILEQMGKLKGKNQIAEQITWNYLYVYKIAKHPWPGKILQDIWLVVYWDMCLFECYVALLGALKTERQLLGKRIPWFDWITRNYLPSSCVAQSGFCLTAFFDGFDHVV